jgi:hypothetical protein
LRTRKIPKKSHFDEEGAAINLQPKTFAECTQVPLKRATLNTDGRGCAPQRRRLIFKLRRIQKYGL